MQRIVKEYIGFSFISTFEKWISKGSCPKKNERGVIDLSEELLLSADFMDDAETTGRPLMYNDFYRILKTQSDFEMYIPDLNNQHSLFSDNNLEVSRNEYWYNVAYKNQYETATKTGEFYYAGMFFLQKKGSRQNSNSKIGVLMRIKAIEDPNNPYHDDKDPYNLELYCLDHKSSTFVRERFANWDQFNQEQAFNFLPSNTKVLNGDSLSVDRSSLCKAENQADCDAAAASMLADIAEAKDSRFYKDGYKYTSTGQTLLFPALVSNLWDFNAYSQFLLDAPFPAQTNLKVAYHDPGFGYFRLSTHGYTEGSGHDTKQLVEKRANFVILNQADPQKNIVVDIFLRSIEDFYVHFWVGAKKEFFDDLPD